MDAFLAIADPTRRRIIELLAAGPRPARLVAESEAGITRPAVSRHLRVLREAGLVEAEVVGRERIYRSTVGPLAPVQAWLDSVRPTGGETPLAALANSLDALDTEVRRARRDRTRPAATTPDVHARSHEEHTA